MALTLYDLADALAGGGLVGGDGGRGFIGLGALDDERAAFLGDADAAVGGRKTGAGIVFAIIPIVSRLRRHPNSGAPFSSTTLETVSALTE
ncbi:MAG: hypothetical protein L0H73_07080 [Nitrococcus sp.]|nr:hypothetical protein [Nitrococcus sp.]